MEPTSTGSRSVGRQLACFNLYQKILTPKLQKRELVINSNVKTYHRVDHLVWMLSACTARTEVKDALASMYPLLALSFPSC